MRTHLQQHGAVDLHWAFELDLDATTTLRLGFGVASKSLGNYKPWLSGIGVLRRKLSGWRGLTSPTLNAEINDEGGRFTLAYGRNHRGRVARCKLFGPETLPAAAHFTYFEGVVDNVAKSANRITMGLRFPDDKTAAPAPRPAITQYVLTSLPGDTDLMGKAIPYLYGNHDSTGLNARGMVKCHYIGSPGANRFQYLAVGGWWQSVVRVLSDNVEQAIPTDCEILQTISGDSRRITVVEFKTDQENKEILIDVQDPDSPAGPGACHQQALADLVYGDYHGVHLDPAIARVNAASIAALDTFLVGRLGLGRSYEVPLDRRTGRDMNAEFCNSFDAYAFYGYDGALHFIPWDLLAQNDTSYLGPGALDVDLAARPVLSSNLYRSEPSFSSDPESAISRVLGKSGRRASDGSWLNPRSVVPAPNEDMERSRTVELPALPATAESVGNLEYMIAASSSGVSGFTATGAASIEAAVSQGPPPGPASNAIRAQSSTKTVLGGGTAQFDIALTDVPEFVAGQTLAIFITAIGRNHDSADADTLTASLIIAGTPYAQPAIVGVSGSQQRYAVSVLTLSPATGQPFTRTELNGASLRVVWDSASAVNGTKRVDVLQAYGTWAYTAAANVSPASLAILSRLANRYRFPPEQMAVKGPLHFLDYQLGDDVPLEDPREGWGIEPYSRGRGRLVGIGIGPGDSVELELEDVRPQITTLWLLGRSLAGVDGASAAGDGMALLVPGNKVTVVRASAKCLDTPAGIGVQSAGPLAQVLNHCWPSGRYGTLPERERKNWQERSSLKSGLTGITQSPGSGTIELDQTVGEQLFVDPAVTDGHLLLTASPTSHATEARATWPTVGSIGSPTAATPGVISIYYRGTGCAFRTTRDADGFYLNNATGLFQAGAVDNTLPDSDSWRMFETNVFSIVAAKTRNYTTGVSLPAGGTLGRTLRVGHVQMEEGEWASSPIVTDAAAVTRVADEISIENDKDDGVQTIYVLPNDRGGLRYHARLNWSSANVTAGTVFQAYTLRYDSNNAWVLGYSVGTGWIFRARSGGANYDATVNVAVVAGVEYDLSLRWTSNNPQEWGKPLTVTLLVRRVSDGVLLGSAETTYVKPVFAAGASLGLGHDTSVAGRQLDGFIIEVRETPFPPSDAAMDAERFELAEAV